MNYERILQTLESIGLHRNEILIYLDLIRSGKSSPTEISERTKIHRSNTYDILNELYKKGFVDETIENNKRFFYPIDPEDILDYLKQKEREIENVLPEIEKIKNEVFEKRRVTISEGYNSARNIIFHLLDLKEPIYSYGMPKEKIELLQGFIKFFHHSRIKKKILFKSIYGIDEIPLIKKLNKMDFTESKYLPFSEQNSTNTICGDKLIIIVWESPVTTIIIQSEKIANSYKEYFKILWKDARFPNQKEN